MKVHLLSHLIVSISFLLLQSSEAISLRNGKVKKTNEEHLNLPFDAANSNELRNMNEQCNISASVKCTVALFGQSCDDIIFIPSLCGDLKVNWEYVVCNHELEEPFVFDESKTLVQLNSNDLENPDLTNIPPQTCKSILETSVIVTTCEPINGFLRAKGFISNDVSCVGKDRFLIAPPLPTSVPSPSPSTEPTIANFSLDLARVLCLVNPDTTCQEYIGNLVGTSEELCAVNVIYRYEIVNDGQICDNTISTVSTTMTDPTGTSVVGNFAVNATEFCPGDFFFIDQEFSVDLCFLAGKGVDFDIKVDEGGEGYIGSALIDFPFPNKLTDTPTAAPTTPLDMCAISSSISCKIIETNVDCNDMIVQPGQCGDIDLQLEMNLCNFEQRRSIFFDPLLTSASINEQNLPDLDTSELPPRTCRSKEYNTMVSSCDGGIEIFLGSRGVIVEDDHVLCVTEERLLIEPTLLSESPSQAPTVPRFGMNLTEVICTVDGTQQTCPVYYESLISKTQETCNVTISNNYMVKNVGQICEDIESINTTFNDQSKKELNIDILTDDEREFCPGEILNLEQRQQIDICYLATLDEGKVPVTLSVNEGGEGRWSENLISFTNQRIAIKKSISCQDRPTMIRFRFTGRTCEESLNSQTSFRCEDFNPIPQEPWVEISSRGQKNKESYFSGFIDHGEIFEVNDSSGGLLRTNLAIRLYKSDKKTLAQRIELKASCVFEELYLADTFGSIEILAFQNQLQQLVTFV